ncbi:transcription factor 7-like 2 [Aplysia californica]|uniref:Transcription factor 7-like 2 n=1 Tax=Aplysia californica TaxID=6500 RepID=A0ABM1VSL4_APLCA|nr:transcription factor 7-like 2 [Aplysia californica]
MVLPGPPPAPGVMTSCGGCCGGQLVLDKLPGLSLPAPLPICPCLLPEPCTLGCVLDLLPGKFSMVQPPYPTGLVMYNDFAQPPPAHKGYPPVYTDPKTGLPRPPMYAAYPTPPGQFPHPLYSPEFTSGSWHRPGYPLTTGAFAGSFPPSLSSLTRYGHPGLLSHPGLGHHGIPHPASLGAGPKSELMSPQLLQDSHRQLNSSQGDENSSCKSSQHAGGSGEETRKKPYVKKPLNAFMLFMKEMRPKVISECTLKESAAINQILGRRWHALDRSEQAKYYEMARKEKELHLQLYPGWSARDNYAAHQKKKKRKKDGPGGGGGGGPGGGMMGMGGPPGGVPMGGASGRGSVGPVGSMCPDVENKPGECPNEKKCRARYGMEQQSRWCKPCRSLHEKSEQAMVDSDQKHFLHLKTKEEVHPL